MEDHTNGINQCTHSVPWISVLIWLAMISFDLGIGSFSLLFLGTSMLCSLSVVDILLCFFYYIQIIRLRHFNSVTIVEVLNAMTYKYNKLIYLLSTTDFYFDVFIYDISRFGDGVIFFVIFGDFNVCALIRRRSFRRKQ